MAAFSWPMGSGVLVVGGGLAGLCCARALARRRIEVTVLEASDAVGGRVRTDVIDGFRIDRGFQVLSTAYPEVQAALDLEALELGTFRPGARIRLPGGGETRLGDPFREPGTALSSALSTAASMADKLRIAALRRRLLATSGEDLWQAPQRPTLEYLRQLGFSDRIVERFLRPFYAGVFLERELVTSSRKFEYTFRCFASGDAALPSGGMQCVPEQLAAGLPGGAASVRLGHRVARVFDDASGVVLEDGRELRAAAIVLATDGPTAHRLWPEVEDHGSLPLAAHLAFATTHAPYDEAVLTLDGTGEGPVNDLCVPSRVAGGYAPEGQDLVSVSVVDVERAAGLSDDALEGAVREQVRGWYGARVDDWRLLGVRRIPHALPRQQCEDLEPHQRTVTFPAREGSGVLYVCGDHREDGSIQGAMSSGRRAALAVSAGLTP